MKLLAGTHYDPAVAATVATSSLLAMTAIDTTNLRLTFTAPSNGSVLVHQRAVISGATTNPTILMGVLDGATIRGRSVPQYAKAGTAAGSDELVDHTAIITGLVAGTSYTWDAAYGVEFAVASSSIKYGGPNNATTNDAWGGYTYEIYDTPGLLAAAHYDPGTAANASIASLQAMTAFDTTNLRLTFTAPSSGIVMVRMRAATHGTTATSGGSLMAGVLDGATVRARTVFASNWSGNAAALQTTDHNMRSARSLVTGLTGGTSYTWDAAMSVEVAAASGNLSYGGPDNTSQDDAWGGFVFDVWNVDDLPRAIGSVA